VTGLAAPPAPLASWAGGGVGIGAGNLIAVAVVLALLGALAWLLRRGKLKLPRRREQAVSVETAVSLGEHRSLVIVAVEGRRLLLGLTPAQVSLVTELQAPGAGFGPALDRRLGPPAEGSVS